ncbi:hypothetical protein FACS189416_3790 [Bacteroidia bacterium]|nr:hypothetical protein FACS189416_3790 [Bacteroidia bacterium]
MMNFCKLKNIKNMKEFFEKIVGRIRDFKFSDTFDDSDDELETVEYNNSIADDDPVLNELIINQ